LENGAGKKWRLPPAIDRSQAAFKDRLERAVRIRKYEGPDYPQNEMRPLTVLLGIVMGSTVSLAVGLLLTWVVILFLPQDEAQFAPEHLPLLRAVAVFTLFAAASAASFYGDLRSRSWRFMAHGMTLAMLGVAVWMYWPG